MESYPEGVLPILFEKESGGICKARGLDWPELTRFSDLSRPAVRVLRHVIGLHEVRYGSLEIGDPVSERVDGMETRQPHLHLQVSESAACVSGCMFRSVLPCHAFRVDGSGCT